MSSVQVEMMLTRAGKRISELSETDIRSNAPLIAGVRDPFGLRISEIFLTYYALREQNHYLNWRKESGRSVEGVVLTDQQFLNCYGPAPWEVMNDALKASGLNYEVTPVVGDTADVTYEPKLVSSSTGTAVTLANLSSGERVLMAIAMSIYLSENLTDAIRMPQVLLLDEADASLHPTMVGNLLRVIGEVFCARFGIKVILTTHSATTVALAPPESIYVMRKTGEPRIRKATRDEVLRELAIGVPTLSVRVEDRIQVFVESEHDQACYAELFRLLRQRLDSPFSLEFIASGKLNRGDSNAVRHLVSKLREGGTTRYGAS
jgi:hypothetical protein